MNLVLFCSQKFDSCVTGGRTDRPTDIPSYRNVKTHLFSILFFSRSRTAIAESAKTDVFCWKNSKKTRNKRQMSV